MQIETEKHYFPPYTPIGSADVQDERVPENLRGKVNIFVNAVDYAPFVQFPDGGVVYIGWNDIVSMAIDARKECESQ